MNVKKRIYIIDIRIISNVYTGQNTAIRVEHKPFEEIYKGEVY